CCGYMINSAKCPSRCMVMYVTRTRVSSKLLEVRRCPSAKALEQPGAFDLGDHRMCFRARDRAASQGHIVVDLDDHAATTEQQHRAQLRVARHANNNFYTLSDHLLNRHARHPSLWPYR